MKAQDVDLGLGKTVFTYDSILRSQTCLHQNMAIIIMLSVHEP